jgi:hypothetical protein
MQEYTAKAPDVAPGGPTSEDRERKAFQMLRSLFTRTDMPNMPYMRVVGRIIEILTRHRGSKTCSAGDVFHILLDEAPGQSGCDPKEYIATRPTRKGRLYDVTRQPGRKSVDSRLNKLQAEGWVTHKQGYVLTDDGKLLFDGWPDLSEIPGLSLTLPPRPTR